VPILGGWASRRMKSLWGRGGSSGWLELIQSEGGMGDVLGGGCCDRRSILFLTCTYAVLGRGKRKKKKKGKCSCAGWSTVFP